MRTALQVVGLAVSIVSGVTGVWALISADSFPLAILAVFVCLVATVALVLAMVSIRRLDRLIHLGTRESRWRFALPAVGGGVSRLATFSALDPGLAESEYKEQFRETANRVCLELAGAFKQVTSAECRITIKETYLNSMGVVHGVERSDLAVKDLASSAPTPRGSVDWVSANTDFNDILRGNATHFFSNDLPAQLRRGYRNSHWTEDRLKQWSEDGNYPYRSTIVWPVRTLVENTDGKLAWSQLGFLCVDSPDSGTFHDIDVAYGDIVARSLYTVWPKGPLPVADEIPSEVPA
jgi:hypothetical protein